MTFSDHGKPKRLIGAERFCIATVHKKMDAAISPPLQLIHPELQHDPCDPAVLFLGRHGQSCKLALWSKILIS